MTSSDPYLSEVAPTWDQALGHIPEIAAALVELGLTRERIPLSFLAVTGFGLVLRRRVLALPAARLIVIGYFLVLMIVYMVAALDPVPLLRVSLDRLMGTLVPAVVLLTLYELGSRWPLHASTIDGSMGGASRDRGLLPAGAAQERASSAEGAP